MSVVVERGLARCPRCVALADYTFVESGPNSLRYEVECRRCGEQYCEVHTPVAPDFSSTVDALVVLPPMVPPSRLATYRRRAAVWFDEVRTRSSAISAAMTSRIKMRLNAFRR